MVNIKKIQSKMKELEMSKAQLITNSGLTRVTIDKILKGGEVNVSTLEALAKGLGVKVGFFFEEDEIKQNISGNGNNQGGRDAIQLNGTLPNTQQEHDELIRLREEIKGLKAKLKDKDGEIQGVKDSKDRELAAKDEIIAELKSALDRVQKMNDYLMGQR